MSLCVSLFCKTKPSSALQRNNNKTKNKNRNKNNDNNRTLYLSHSPICSRKNAPEIELHTTTTTETRTQIELLLLPKAPKKLNKKTNKNLMISFVLKYFFRFQISSVKNLVENLNFSIANFETLEKPRSEKKLAKKSNQSSNRTLQHHKSSNAVRDGHSFVSRGKTDQWNCFPRNTKAMSGREREGPSLSSLSPESRAVFFFLFFFGGEKSPKGNTEPNFWRKVPVFSKTSCQISPSFNIFLGRVSPHACL